MTRTRRKTLTPPRNPWETTLEEMEGPDRFVAGEVEPGDEERGGGDKGLDSDTGDGGYGGDAVLDGYEESSAQAERPTDKEIHGDPRTHEGESYPDDLKALDPRQSEIGQTSLEDEEDRSGA